MPLSEYKKKRNFIKTKEPKAIAGKVGLSRFVIQEHRATNLHYDFRLEDHDDKGQEVVLRSWAIPKNIPEQPGVKHLAIQTEDHPQEYIGFQGEIPNGEYGAGSVKIWDKGKWKVVKGSLKEGKIIIGLKGKIIKGDYFFLRTRGYSKKGINIGEGSNWLIWKT